MNWLQVYRTTPHAATSTSPYELLYGQKMRTKLDILPLPSAMSSLCASARLAVQRHQNKMQRSADAKRGTQAPSFLSEFSKMATVMYVGKLRSN